MHLKLAAPVATRINIGCGDHPLLDWCNIDASPKAHCDFIATIPPIPYESNSLEEIFAGHYLEHLTQDEAQEFLAECHRCLIPGGILGIVVPDTREVIKRYLDPKSNARIEFPRGSWFDLHDMNNLCKFFFYSTAQESHHQWSYDKDSLTKLLEKSGFIVKGEINRWMDPRISVGAWYQFGLDATKEA